MNNTSSHLWSFPWGNGSLSTTDLLSPSKIGDGEPSTSKVLRGTSKWACYSSIVFRSKRGSLDGILLLGEPINRSPVEEVEYSSDWFAANNIAHHLCSHCLLETIYLPSYCTWNSFATTTHRAGFLPFFQFSASSGPPISMIPSAIIISEEY
jgi:hypothetical protein